jgi:seryl-tRNA synthetase
MLDLKFNRENIDAVKLNIANRSMNADANEVVALADRRSKLIQDLDDLRQKRNENVRKMKVPMDNDARLSRIAEGTTPSTSRQQ